MTQKWQAFGADAERMRVVQQEWVLGRYRMGGCGRKSLETFGPIAVAISIFAAEPSHKIPINELKM